MELTCITLTLPEHIKALSHVVQRINDFVIPETIDAAVYNDCQYIINVHGATRRWTTKAMDEAAARGRLDLVKWLSSTRSEGCTIAAIDGAVRNGHLKMVKWLSKHAVRRCSSCALNVAAQNGHVEVVKWLCRRNRGRDPFVITYGVQAIARTGDTNALRILLRENCSWYYVGRALEDAASEGMHDVVKLLLTVNIRQSNVSRAMNNAVAMRHIEIVKVLGDLCSSSELRAALSNLSTECNNTKIADYLRKSAEGRDIEEKWGYYRTQHKTLESTKTARYRKNNQDKLVSFCGLLRSW